MKRRSGSLVRATLAVAVVTGLAGGAVLGKTLVKAEPVPAGPAVAPATPGKLSLPGRRAQQLQPPPIHRTAVGVISPALRDLPRATATPPLPEVSRPEVELPAGPEHRDPVVQRSAPAAMPGPIMSFDGISNNDNWTIRGASSRPPDPTGEAGPNHYVEWVNSLVQVFTKTGTSVSGPVTGNSLFQNLPNPQDVCRTTNQGDPLVHYDQLANRWVLSQFAFNLVSQGGQTVVAPPFHECVAVSTSPDPTGTYCTYSLFISGQDFNDYPKMGVWPDGYYFSFNMFAGGTVYAGPAMMAANRQDMLSCQPVARYVVLEPANFPALATQQPFLPSDLDGATLPPAGSPNYFVGLNSANNGLLLRKFSVNWSTTPPTVTAPATATTITVASFDRDICPATREQCITQKDTPNSLEAISDRVMMRLAYRNFGTHESLVVNHTVDVDNTRAGVRWYELRSPNTTPTVHQQSTFAPDAHHRWMGSAAMDRRGDLAVGYSVSSSTLHPSIRYAGRLAEDPLNQLTQGEAEMFAGTFSAPVTAFTGGDPRWGDYTHLVTDPVDDCTFWYVNEYQRPEPIGDGSLRRWQTRIGSFKFAECQKPPTAATVASFAARWRGASVRVAWRTASEVDALGFDVYRSAGTGPFRKINPTLIAARHPGQARGAAYRFVDSRVRRGQTYTYRLQTVDRKGKRSWYGIGSAAVR